MRSAMFSRKRSLVTGLVAASLLATMVAETGQSPAAAKALDGAVKTNLISTGDYGPVCPITSSSRIKLINNGTARTYTIAELTACANYAVPSGSPTPEISPTPRPSSTTAASPYPSPSLIPLPGANSISYSIGTNPLGMTVSISEGKLIVSTTAVAGDSTLELLATHAYLDPLEGSYEYLDTTAISVPVTVKAPSRPTCQIFTTSTSVGTPVSVTLAFDDVRAGGCKGKDEYGSLSYTFTAENGTVLINSDLVSATFEPESGFQTPADNTVKASFAVIATDEYGQGSVALDQNGVAIAGTAGAKITINVIKIRPCIGYTAKTETIFNNPLAKSSRDGQLSNSRFAITNRITDMIDCAPRNSIIAMSWFSFTDDNMVNHLIQAKKRGVNVRVLVNSHATKKSSSSFTAVNTLKKALGTTITIGSANANSGVGSWVDSCDSGCLTPPKPKGVVFPSETEGEYPALHSKFFMITHAGSAKNIVGISSVNPTYEQAKVGFNNASVVVNDKVLFNSLNQYYSDLAYAAAPELKKKKATAYRQLKSSSKTTNYYVYPKTGSDDILTMLRDIKCVYKEGGKTKRTQIYVNMFVFTRNSPAMELWKKAFASSANNGGCNVHIIYTDMDQRIKALNTKTKKVGYIPSGGRASNWGVADCLSTMPSKKLTAPGLVFDAEKKRMVAAKVCKNGSLQGAIPTINKKGGYCWFNAKNKKTGGSLSMCVSTPLKITANDKADNRAKLEAVADKSGRRWYSHQKYIAIDGMYGKKGKQKRQQIVISGTPNITSPGQKWNDEILTFTTSAKTYAQYVANFKETKAAIKRRPGPSGKERAEARW